MRVFVISCHANKYSSDVRAALNVGPTPADKVDCSAFVCELPCTRHHLCIVRSGTPRSRSTTRICAMATNAAVIRHEYSQFTRRKQYQVHTVHPYEYSSSTRSAYGLPHCSTKFTLTPHYIFILGNFPGGRGWGLESTMFQPFC